MNKDKQLIGSSISAIRKSRCLTQTELAEKTTLTQNHISRIESGQYIPRVDIAKRIADALGCSVDDFLKTE